MNRKKGLKKGNIWQGGRKGKNRTDFAPQSPGKEKPARGKKKLKYY